MDCCLNCWLITCWRHHSSFKLTIHYWMLWMARTLKRHGNTGHQINTEAVKQKENQRHVMLREKENRASHKSIYFVKRMQERVLHNQWLYFLSTVFTDAFKFEGFFYVLINSKKFKHKSHSYHEDEGAQTLCQALADQLVTNLEEAREFVQIQLLSAHVAFLSEANEAVRRRAQRVWKRSREWHWSWEDRAALIQPTPA